MTDNKTLYESGVLDTNDGKDPESFESGAPGPIGADGQHTQYWVLSEAERQKGFIRPVRNSYKHVGARGPQYPTRPLTAKEQTDFADCGWALFELYPPGLGGSGRYWKQAELDRVNAGCGTVTHMGRAIAETYARSPHMYGSTMCVGCGTHLPVGEYGEFVWINEDGSVSSERVGT